MCATRRAANRRPSAAPVVSKDPKQHHGRDGYCSSAGPDCGDDQKISDRVGQRTSHCLFGSVPRRRGQSAASSLKSSGIGISGPYCCIKRSVCNFPWRGHIRRGIAGDPKGPLFRTIGRSKGRPLARTVPQQADSNAVIARRCAAAGITIPKNGGTLEKPRRWPTMPARAPPSYTITDAMNSLDEVAREDQGVIKSARQHQQAGATIDDLARDLR